MKKQKKTKKKIKKEELNLIQKDNNPIFINVGKKKKKQKKISRIINATEKLNKQGYKFKVLLIGKGPNTEDYKKTIKEKNLDNIIMLGAKKNPYPYFKLSDCFILSSEFEGYPVVFVESQIMGVPIVTTNVSDSKKDIDGKYGMVVDNSEDGVYIGMKEFLDNGIKVKKFNPKEFNEEITKKIRGIIND